MYPYISTNEKGQLLPIASTVKVKEVDKAIISKLIQKLLIVLGNNLYSVILRGSVACGKAIEKISDLDMIIFPRNYLESQRVQVEALSVRLTIEYSGYYSLIDLSYVNRKELLDIDKNIRMILNITLTGITVYGENIISQFEPMFLTKELASKIANQAIIETRDNLLRFETGLKGFSYMGLERDVAFFCVWTMRVICRGLIAPVMIQNGKFTLNVETAGNEFINLYPELTDAVQQFLEWEKHPTGQESVIISKVGSFVKKFEQICKECSLF